MKLLHDRDGQPIEESKSYIMVYPPKGKEERKKNNVEK